MPLTNHINCLLFSYWSIGRWQLLIFSSKHAIEPVLDLAMAGCWYSALNLNILIKIVFCLNMRTGNFIFHEFWAIKIAYSLIFSRSKQVFSRKDCLDLGHCTAWPFKKSIFFDWMNGFQLSLLLTFSEVSMLVVGSLFTRTISSRLLSFCLFKNRFQIANKLT